MKILKAGRQNALKECKYMEEGCAGMKYVALKQC